jgi:glutaminyl-tRNA synthetase
LTRFPPEPNGFLHIGHAKAINVNFGYALAHGGKCYLRYDDTNPEAEEQRYFDTIKETVEWLGFKPWKITYSSDHFQRLYDLALQLIRVDKAYVCHCTGEEIQAQRGGESRGPRFDCKHRSRPTEESLKEFVRMKEGYYKEGEATLRMKMDMQNPNPQFWDLVAYRVMFTHHVRTGNQWCIYPTYDYTHCLCDSFENITHSLCTTEFRASRESYYWLCDALEVYKPVQWEYGRLNITNTVMSKRKLLKLVEQKIVSGWDDPRLFTLMALKRRGCPPQAINQFVRECGVTTAQATTDVRRFEYVIRQFLDDTVARVSAIVHPLPVLLVNVPVDHYSEIEAPYMPKTKVLPEGIPVTHKLPFTNTLFIDKSDFKLDAATDPNFFRLGLHSTVNLLYLRHAIYCHEVVRDTNGEVIALAAVFLDPSLPYPTDLPPRESLPKARSYIQWVALSQPSPKEHRIISPQECEMRLYNDLFLHGDPENKVEVPGGWMSDINPKSLEICHGLMESGLALETDSKKQSTYHPYFKSV